MSTSTRDHSLDAGRGILMGLGVLLHTANIYAPGGGWIIADTRTHAFFGYLSEIIHIFRMPVFFWISGYFCCMGFMKLGSKALLQVRMPRLLVPLLSALLTLNVLQSVLVGWHQGLSTSQVLQQGLKLHHLWFLVYLLIFFALAGLVLPHCRNGLNRLTSARAPGWLTLAVVLAAVSFLLEAAVRLTGVAYQSLWGLASLFGLTRYLAFFAVGVLMYAWRDARQNLAAAPVWLIGPVLAVDVGLTQFAPNLKGWQGELVQWAHWLGAWICVGLALGLFERLFKSDTPFTRLVSESAYTVYLFHHLLVVAVGMALLSFALPLGVKFVLVCTIAWTVGLVVHLQVIRRVPVLQWLFNGRGSVPKRPEPTA